MARVEYTGYVCQKEYIEVRDEGRHAYQGGFHISTLHLCHPEWREQCEFRKHHYTDHGCLLVTVVIEVEEAPVRVPQRALVTI